MQDLFNCTDTVGLDVHQDIALGPVLFLAYIKDFSEYLISSKGFADLDATARWWWESD